MALSFGLLVFPSIQQLDLTGPYEVFSSAEGADVHLIWKDRNPVKSSSGLTFIPTATFDDCPQLDGICIPGGGVNPLLTDDVVLDFVRQQARGARYVTSVCTGALVLGAAGLLEGRRATTHWNAMDFLKHFGAIATEARVVRDGNVITAGGVTSGIDFGLSILAEVFGQTEAETVQLTLEYAPSPPFKSGTPGEARAEVLERGRERLAASRAAREAIFSHWKRD
ncbi:DJ-1/PfpI family protein [Brucella intermedia]|uniref:DJ-1/PfpI family protein n=1 Tax=Brucella intermedia TaxID=94625 RepID=UPI00124D227E|nr:DJ-1/PfpI family protein [Brucella intermedia]KAB2720716.1 DJ-1/PfpI family protein [Brucella intermedia]